MDYTKYIIDDKGNFLIFSNVIHHRTAASTWVHHCRGNELVGAGFISLYQGQVSCWGYSESLRGLKSREIVDAEVIAKHFGLTVKETVPQG
jgi:hypothetical protein